MCAVEGRAEELSRSRAAHMPPRPHWARGTEVKEELSFDEQTGHPFFITLVLGHTTANQALHAAAIVKLADVSFVSFVEESLVPTLVPHRSQTRTQELAAPLRPSRARGPRPLRPACRATPAAPRLPALNSAQPGSPSSTHPTLLHPLTPSAGAFLDY